MELMEVTCGVDKISAMTNDTNIGPPSVDFFPNPKQTNSEPTVAKPIPHIYLANMNNCTISININEK